MAHNHRPLELGLFFLKLWQERTALDLVLWQNQQFSTSSVPLALAWKLWTDLTKNTLSHWFLRFRKPECVISSFLFFTSPAKGYFSHPVIDSDVVHIGREKKGRTHLSKKMLTQHLLNSYNSSNISFVGGRKNIIKSLHNRLLVSSDMFNKKVD